MQDAKKLKMEKNENPPKMQKVQKVANHNRQRVEENE